MAQHSLTHIKISLQGLGSQREGPPQGQPLAALPQVQSRTSDCTLCLNTEPKFKVPRHRWPKGQCSSRRSGI